MGEELDFFCQLRHSHPTLFPETMKKVSLLLVAVACATTTFAQNEVKTTSKNEATGAKTEKKSEMRDNGSTKTTTMHKTGRTTVGEKVHKAHMKAKKAA